MATDTATPAEVTPPHGSVERPPRMSQNPLRRVGGDLAAEWRARGKFPPGDLDLSILRTHKMATDPLPVLLSAYERFGPVFTLRLLHSRVVFLLGPEANHFVLVSGADNFHWREGSFGDLIPLLGDGLLTIDDGYHDKARATMMPAFHHDQVSAAVDAMAAEAAPLIDSLRPGEVV